MMVARVRTRAPPFDFFRPVHPVLNIPSMDSVRRTDPQSRHWSPITLVHTAAAANVIALGGTILALRKGTPLHRRMVQVWTATMATACVSSFGIRDSTGGFSWIHGLSTYTLYCIGAGVYHIRKKNRRAHSQYMRGVYIGAAVAGCLLCSHPAESSIPSCSDHRAANLTRADSV